MITTAIIYLRRCALIATSVHLLGTRIKLCWCSGEVVGSETFSGKTVATMCFRPSIKIYIIFFN